jgi:hypothetical protein
MVDLAVSPNLPFELLLGNDCQTNSNAGKGKAVKQFKVKTGKQPLVKTKPIKIKPDLGTISNFCPQKLIAAQQNDPSLKKSFYLARKAKLNLNKQKGTQFKVIDNVLYREWQSKCGLDQQLKPVIQLVVPNEYRRQVFNEIRHSFPNECLSKKKTLRLIERTNYWPGLRQNVSEMFAENSDNANCVTS